MTSEKRPTVAVVVPCYDEIEIIETCATRLLEIEAVDLVALVDDGSTDGSAEACSMLAERFHPRVKAVLLPANAGKNLAVRAAASQIQADVILVFDADLTVDPAHVQLIAGCFSRGLNRFVYGSRLGPAMQKGAMPLLNRCGNRFFALWVSRLVGRKVGDVLCGVKAMPRESLLKIPPSKCRWGDFDMMFGAAEQGLEFQEIALPYKCRTAGASKMRVFKSGLYFFRLCASRSCRVLARKLKTPRRFGAMALSRAKQDKSPC